MENFVGIINYIVFFAITAATYGILALGLNIQWGNTGLFNIGIAGFYALGAYTSALISGLPPSAWEGRTFGGFELPFIFGWSRFSSARRHCVCAPITSQLPPSESLKRFAWC